MTASDFAALVDMDDARERPARSTLTDAEVDEFLDRLTKPMFVWRMSRAKAAMPGRVGKSARTSLVNARNQIRELIAKRR
jgi:hypothetical protein